MDQKYTSNGVGSKNVTNKFKKRKNTQFSLYSVLYKIQCKSAHESQSIGHRLMISNKGLPDLKGVFPLLFSQEDDDYKSCLHRDYSHLGLSLKSPVLVQSLVNYRNVIWKGGATWSLYTSSGQMCDLLQMRLWDELAKQGPMSKSF